MSSESKKTTAAAEILQEEIWFSGRISMLSTEKLLAERRDAFLRSIPEFKNEL